VSLGGLAVVVRGDGAGGWFVGMSVGGAGGVGERTVVGTEGK
jgi:hypothetical protein